MWELVVNGFFFGLGLIGAVCFVYFVMSILGMIFRIGDFRGQHFKDALGKKPPPPPPPTL